MFVKTMMMNVILNNKTHASISSLFFSFWFIILIVIDVLMTREVRDNLSINNVDEKKTKGNVSKQIKE